MKYTILKLIISIGIAVITSKISPMITEENIRFIVIFIAGGIDGIILTNLEYEKDKGVK